MDAVKRFQIADYLNVGTGETEEFVLMGFGFNTLNESPSAQASGKVYIHQKAQTNSIQSYQPSFPFDTDLVKDEKAVMSLYEVGRNELTGAEAERDYVRVDLFQGASEVNEYPARKFRVAVQVDSIEGEGGGIVKCTGSLLSVGDFVDGTFNTQTKTFTAKA